MDDRRRLQVYLLLVLMPLFYSSNLVLGRVAVVSSPPFALAFWRWSVAFLILLPFAWPGLRASARPIIAEWRSLAGLGFLGMVICGAGVYLALRHTTATNATLIYSASPIMIVMLEWLWSGRRIGAVEGVGIAAAFVGVATIVCRGDPAALLALRFNGGDLGIAASAFCWAIYSVMLRRPGLQTIPTLPLFATIAGAGALLLAPAAAVEAVLVGTPPATVEVCLSILGLAIVPSVLAFLTFQMGVKLVGPSPTGVFLYLMPIYGVLMAVIFLGEALRPYHALGMVLTLSGVLLAGAQGSLRRLRDRRAAGA